MVTNTGLLLHCNELVMKYISPTAPLLIIKREARETRRPDLGLPKGLIIWLSRIPPLLFLIPLLLFGGVDIDEHTKRWINPEKKYEISGQHILNTINTIDSLENVIDSLSKNNNSVDTFTLYDTLIWTQLDNSVDTLYDTVRVHSIETLYDTVYIDQLATQPNETHRTIILAGVLLFFMAAMGYVSSREYKKK